jgi:threonine dehydratase
MVSSPGSRLPTAADVADAAARLDGVAVRTPLLTAPTLDAATGARILVKPEVLQRTGSFKFRGAYNRISRLNAAERAGGVVAFSSGNHGQAVAAVARLMTLPATIVMPADAPAMKIEATRGHGAFVVLYDRDREDREEIAGKIVRDKRATLVPPFDDPLVIAGQGTVGREIAEDAAQLGVTVEVLLAPCSGGGLIAGTTLALKDRFPQLASYAVEPDGFDDTARSLRQRARVANSPGRRTLCDALMVAQPGALTFALNQTLLAGGISVSDDEALSAMEFAFRTLKLVLEPSGAVALAALLARKIDVAGKTVAVVCSGGNVDGDVFGRALTHKN